MKNFILFVILLLSLFAIILFYPSPKEVFESKRPVLRHEGAKPVQEKPIIEVVSPQEEKPKNTKPIVPIQRYKETLPPTPSIKFIKQKNAKAIAEKINVIGRFGATTCLPFATNLHRKLSKEGIKSKFVIVAYAYKDDKIPRQHALVIFKDEDGEFVIDNMMPEAQPLKTTICEFVQMRNKQIVEIALSAEVGD